ncbi:MAG: M24 family metallopeptidase [Gemmatimonadales bacterium]|nr:MAG: M24 family metallopeptidase [Gemmatimonadales bacterium]
MRPAPPGVPERPSSRRQRFRRVAARVALVTAGAFCAVGSQLFTAEAHAQVPDAEFHERRAALSAPDGDGILVALGSAGSRGAHLSFQYLTGLVETDAVLLVEREGDRVRSTIFVPDGAAEPRMADGRTLSEASVRGEGNARPGDAVSDAGTDAPRDAPATMLPLVLPMAEFEAALLAGVTRHGGLSMVGPDDLRQDEASPATPALARVLEQGGSATGGGEIEVRRVNARVSQMRAVKSPAELELIRRAVAVTEEAHRALLGAIRPGITEADLKVVIDSVFAVHGADETPAFPHIVASAENSTILHYRGGDRVLREDEHVKIDIGAAYHGYAADVTRTYPVNGRFSPELSAIYQVVLDAQGAAEALARERAARSDMSRAADSVLAEGLTALGLIESPTAMYDCPARGGADTADPAPATRECRQLGLLYFHALGHGIGLNVHDPTPAAVEDGSAISIEPGIYVRPGFLDSLPDTPRNRAMIGSVAGAWARYGGIGVRIEDNYLMTEAGLEWISRAPREIADIEDAMERAALLAGSR